MSSEEVHVNALEFARVELLGEVSHIMWDISTDVGNYLVTNKDNIIRLGKKAVRDELLEADLVAEHMILNQIVANYPDHRILSEEDGMKANTSRYGWIVDPLDGTFNYEHGWDMYAISIGFYYDDKLLLGSIFLPEKKEFYFAIAGGGAFLNGKEIHVSEQQNLGDALVCIGDYSKTNNERVNKEILEDKNRLKNHIGRERDIGSAAIDDVLVASGKADTHILRGNTPWDYEVGKLLVREAGGRVSEHCGIGPDKLTVISNGKLHDEVLFLLFENNRYPVS